MLLQTSSTPDFFLFLGRFHPLLVHLPIGILLLAAIMEFVSRKEKYKHLDGATQFVLLIGAISAVASAFLGYLLSLGGDYAEGTLFWHKWLGIALAIFAIVAYFAKAGKLSKIKLPAAKLNAGLAIAIMVLMTITGHLGGSLTHGSSYLIYYAPQPIRALAGLPSRVKEKRPPVTNLDSAELFADVIMPIMEDRCESCHNPGKKKGGLDLSTKEKILEGGKHGEVITPGDAGDSDLHYRITLDEDDEDAMPPEGKRRLTEDQITLIEWWIDQGADFDKKVADVEIEDEMKSLIAQAVGLESKEGESGLLASQIEPASQEAITDMQNQGFKVYQIAQEINYLDVDFSLADTTLGGDQIKSLLDAKEQIVWLNLSRSTITDDGLQTVGQLPNLLKLRLDQTEVTDAGIAHLTNLKQLEYLNLYGTKVGDGIVEHIKQLPNLKKLFLWQTNITEEAVSELRAAMPELDINTGVDFSEVTQVATE